MTGESTVGCAPDARQFLDIGAQSSAIDSQLAETMCSQIARLPHDGLTETSVFFEYERAWRARP